MGNVIPFDGYVAEGEAMVNQSSLTGESVPIPKDYNDCVYAGLVVESGELTIRVTAKEGKSRYDRIVTMIEETEKLKSAMEGKATSTVVDAANAKNLEHNELHTRAEYVVAHGISTTADGKETILGSRHFVFEDEKCQIPLGKEELFHSLPAHQSHLFLASEKVQIGVICIEDPIRPEAVDVIGQLRQVGFTKVVIMTGDSERTAASVANTLGVHEYYSEVLLEDKANFILEQKALGRKVVMIGDGINDSPALSAADVGIAISDGAEIAREIADITVGAEDLYQLIILKKLNNELVKRIQKNYRDIVGINGVLIGLGVAGIIMPTLSAMIHNTSTLLIAIDSMTDLLE